MRDKRLQELPFKKRLHYYDGNANKKSKEKSAVDEAMEDTSNTGKDDASAMEYAIETEKDSSENTAVSDEQFEKLPEEEIEQMLPDNVEAAQKTEVEEKPFVTRQQLVLEEKGAKEVLPLNWVMVTHMCGMPVYMHRSTRVCTLSRPYCLAEDKIRRHDIPISAIPCFAYRKALEEEEKEKEINIKGENIEEDIKRLQEMQSLKREIVDSPVLICPVSDKADDTPVVEDGKEEKGDEQKDETISANSQPGGYHTINTSLKHLSAEQIHNYCKTLFKFKTIKRRVHRRKTLQYPMMSKRTIPGQPAVPGEENGG